MQNLFCMRNTDLDCKGRCFAVGIDQSAQSGCQGRMDLCRFQIWFRSASLWLILLLQNLHHGESLRQVNPGMHSSMVVPSFQLQQTQINYSSKLISHSTIYKQGP